jgi:hypothetical protein
MLVKGGPVSEAEEADEEYRFAIASESFVRRYIQGNPLGRHIGMGSDPGTPTRLPQAQRAIEEIRAFLRD